MCNRNITDGRSMPCKKCDSEIYAAVTQWIRVLRYERRSQEFESLRWRQCWYNTVVVYFLGKEEVVGSSPAISTNNMHGWQSGLMWLIANQFFVSSNLTPCSSFRIQSAITYSKQEYVGSSPINWVISCSRIGLGARQSKSILLF